MKETGSNLKKVFQLGKEYTWAFLLELCTTIVQIIIGILLPLFLARQIVLLTDSVYEEILFVSVGVFFIGFINNINFAVMKKVCQIFRRGTTKNIQIALGQEILNVSQSDLLMNGTGTFIERMTQDVDKMSEIFTKGVGYVSGVIINLGIFITIFVINKVVFLYYLFVALSLTFFYLYKTNKIGKKDSKYRKQKEKVSGFIGELVHGEKDIKMLSAKKTFMRQLSLEIVHKNACYNDMRILDIYYGFFIDFLTNLFELFLIILLVYLIKQEELSVSLAVALFTYKTNIMTNLMEKVSLLLEEVKNFNISAERVFAILYDNQFKKEQFGTKHISCVVGHLVFSGVSFSYGDYKVIDDMSFQIQPGETVAFVGKSGSGKSTIFNLLGKLYDADKGKICMDGHSFATLDEDSIRGNITMISQSPYIFHMSIRENFLLVKENVTEEEIYEALHLACLDAFVATLPKGIDTVIGEGGTNLSGGQRQRLAIARALAQKTPIILFDEATSALDNETQKNIQKAIENLKGNYTILIIAHRLSTIIHADRILVVDKGKIIAEGTHKELLKTCPNYKKLYESELIENESLS